MIAIETATAIREATDADVPPIVAMAQAFLRETPYGQHMPTRPEALAAFAGRLIMSPDGVILVAPQPYGDLAGMIALWSYLHPMSGEVVASELVWWVNPAARGSLGVRLVRRAEAWARAKGAVVLQMIAPTHAPRVGEFYRALGFDEIETSYQKRF